MFNNITVELLYVYTSQNSAPVMFILAGYINSSYYSPICCKFLPVMNVK